MGMKQASSKQQEPGATKQAQAKHHFRENTDCPFAVHNKISLEITIRYGIQSDTRFFIRKLSVYRLMKTVRI